MFLILFLLFIFIYLINLFLFFAVSGLSCDTWDLRCGMWSLLLQHAGFSLVVVHGLQGAWAL